MSKVIWTDQDSEILNKEVRQKMFDMFYRRYFPVTVKPLTEDALVNALTDKYMSMPLAKKEELEKQALTELMRDAVRVDSPNFPLKPESKVVKLLQLYAQEERFEDGEFE